MLIDWLCQKRETRNTGFLFLYGEDYNIEFFVCQAFFKKYF
nr:MAG TPA: hypothetical protein [Siphoviridae sp. ctngg6]